MVEQYFRDKKFNVLMGSTHPLYSIATFDTEEKDFREKYWDIKENDVVFDIGASYGAYTLSACSMGATVYSFEPEKTVYCDLVSNINLNSFIKCVPQNLALWNVSTEIDMKTYAKHWPAQTITSDYETTTIDDTVKKYNIQKIDWIKIDVEGAEINVVHGGLKSFNKFKPKLIIECHTFIDLTIPETIKSLLKDNYNFEEIERDPCIMLMGTPK